jgi:nicotinate-nucleotide pyrophosphorylase (carboxylating)
MSKKYLKSIIPLIKLGLKEDIGKGDITSNLVIPKNLKAKVMIISKDNGIICGLEIAKLVFKILDKRIKFKKLVRDGEKVKPGQKIAIIQGNARKILAGERTTLNFLQHLSGIATLTRKYADLVKPFKVKILDTRKTIPGLRLLEKYAVRVGGGKNHRFGLWDQILIKSNHVDLVGIKKSLKMAKRSKKKIEIEVRNFEELKEALRGKPDIIMLDNMNLKQIRKAVKLIGKKALTEVSGRVNLKNIRKIASSGVQRISIGQLTHSAKALDLAMRIVKLKYKKS